MLVISTTISTIEKDLLACRLAKEIDKDIIMVAKGPIFLQ